MKTILKFLIPNRRDVPVLILCLLLLNVIVIPECILFLKYLNASSYTLNPIRRSELFPLFIPLSALTLSVGVGLSAFSGSQRYASWRWLMAMFAGWWLLGWLLYRESLLFETLMLNEQTFAGTLTIWWGQPLLFLFSWLLGTGARKLSRILRGNRQNTGLNQQHGLIVAAVLLFVIYTIGRFLHGTDVIRYLSNLGNDWTNLALFILSAIVLLGVVPSQINELWRGWFSLPLVSIYFAGLAATLTVISGPETLGLTVPYAIVATGILIGLKFHRESLNSIDANKKSSIWPAVCGTLTIGLLGISLFFSLNTLRYFAPDWFSIARQVKQLNTLPNVIGTVTAQAPSGIYQTHAELVFAAGADPNCLKSLPRSHYYRSLSLQNLTPQIETSYTSGAAIDCCYILDSEITAEQFVRLASVALNMSISNCRMTELENSHQRSPTVASRLFVSLDKLVAGETAKFLKALTPSMAGGASPGLHLYFGNIQLSDDDVETIIESSLQIPIDLRSASTPIDIERFVKYFESDANQEIAFHKYQLSITVDADIETEIIRLILSTPISPKFGYSVTEQGVQFPMDILFASKQSDLAFHILKAGSSFLTTNQFPPQDVIQQYHWSFDIRETNDGRGLLLPLSGESFIEEVGQMNDLEILSLDGRWLTALSEIRHDSIPQDRDLSPLARLTQLKRLDLPSGIFTTDLSFLKSMPKLQHLQIDLFGNGTSKPKFDFDAEYCPNLETLVVFGRPSPAVAKEIAKLPKLNSLTVVDIDGTLAGPWKAPARQTFSSIIGESIAIEFVANDDFLPATPSEFQQHLERVRKLVRQKYLDQSELIDVNLDTSRRTPPQRK